MHQALHAEGYDSGPVDYVYPVLRFPTDSQSDPAVILTILSLIGDLFEYRLKAPAGERPEPQRAVLGDS